MLLKSHMKPFPSLREEMRKLNALESNYKYMLDYIAEGHPDPSQNEMIEQLKDSLLRANDILYREMKLIDSPDSYSAARRLLNVRNSSFKVLYDNWRVLFDEDNKKEEFQTEDFEKKEEEYKEGNRNNSFIISATQAQAMDELFNYLWTGSSEENEEINLINTFFENNENPDLLKSFLISAMVLANIEYFNTSYYILLLNIYENSPSLDLKSKALTGLILIALLHPRRIKGNLQLRSRLMLLSEDEEFKKLINDTLLNIIRTYDTKRVDDKIRNEVIPGLMKIQPDIMDKMRNMSSDSEDFLSMENPAWEEMLENSDIGDKIQEINEMQMEGADVMVTTFSNLKSFPFFNKISNWFIPFNRGNYQFTEYLKEEDGFLERLTSVMCDSDIHSFLLSLGSLPQEKRNQTFSMMSHQIKEAQAAMTNGIEEESETKKLTKKIRHNLQDLYRFFKYYKKKEEFKDPFEHPFIETQISPLMPILGIDVDNIRVVAEFYFKNKYYNESAGLFELVESENPGDFTLWEKIGYSHDRMSRYEAASEWYMKADLINGGNEWLNKKLAVTLKNAGRYKDAIEYFEKALSNDPENYHLLMSMGQCFLEDRKPKESLQYFYHAQYLKPEKKSPKRAIAWAELLSGNLEKAKSYYEKILEEGKIDNADRLNFAHASLASGDFKKALSLYKSFVENTPDKDMTRLVIALREDAETLRQLKIKTSDLRLIVDKIRYDFYD